MSNEQKYSKAVKIAEISVKDISDPKLKLEAFRTILQDILGRKTAHIEPKKNSEIETSTQKEYPNGSKSLRKKFTDYLKISDINLDLIYNLREDESYTITCDFKHETGKWSQIQFVLLSLFANYIKTGKKKSASLPIIREMKKHRFGELPNINSYMKSIGPQIVHSITKPKKSENTFELTDRGIKVTAELIKEIIEKGGIVPDYPKEFPARIMSVKKKSGLFVDILNLINEGFFNTPKPISDLKKKLYEKGSFYPRGVIDEKVRRGFLGKELRRLKDGKKWVYVKK